MSVQYFGNDISPTDSKSRFSFVEFKVEIVSLVFVLFVFLHTCDEQITTYDLWMTLTMSTIPATTRSVR
jgi:hypothetical protein